MNCYSIEKLSLITAVLIVLLFFCSCSREKKKAYEDKVVIVTVNNEEISLETLLEFIGLESTEELSEAERRNSIDDLIKLTLLAQEAERRGVDSFERIRERINIAEKRIKANALLAMSIHDIELSESEVFNYYQIHKNRYVAEREEYRIQRILLENEAIADSVSTMIVDGTLSFGEAAGRFSQERARETEGYIGYRTPDELEAGVWNVVSQLGQWRFSRVRVSNGILLVRYTDKRNRRVERPFTEVSEKVREELLEERRKDIVQSLVQDLLSKAEIEISR